MIAPHCKHIDGCAGKEPPTINLAVIAFLVSIALLACVGCSRSASSNPDDYIGEYVFMPSNADPRSFGSIVILKKDQCAIEIHFVKETGEVEMVQKKWYLTYTTSEHLVIGEFSHPIEHSRSSIKLIIDGDLGKYYEKVR